MKTLLIPFFMITSLIFAPSTSFGGRLTYYGTCGPDAADPERACLESALMKLVTNRGGQLPKIESHADRFEALQFAAREVLGLTRDAQIVLACKQVSIGAATMFEFEFASNNESLLDDSSPETERIEDGSYVVFLSTLHSWEWDKADKIKKAGEKNDSIPLDKFVKSLLESKTVEPFFTGCGGVIVVGMASKKGKRDHNDDLAENRARSLAQGLLEGLDKRNSSAELNVYTLSIGAYVGEEADNDNQRLVYLIGIDEALAAKSDEEIQKALKSVLKMRFVDYEMNKNGGLQLRFGKCELADS